VSVWIVVGGQYGSEGKGKIAAFITQQEGIDLCIRCGGPNSGHSFVAEDGTQYLVRQLPTGFVRPETRLLIPAGALVDLDVLQSEIQALGLEPHRVGIDRNAMIIEEQDSQNEARLQLRERLSSTLCGVGSAVSRRALREPGVRLARQAAIDHQWLSDLLTDTADEVNRAVDLGRGVLIEGTQGFGLSLYHSEEYPKATSRDTSAAAFLSEVGLSPLVVTDIVLVLRTFPIRVSGAQAGSLKREITWELLQRESGYPHPIHEITSVTRQTRRVARFDWELAAAATRVNRPTKLAINGLDYLSYSNTRAGSLGELTEETRLFLTRLEHELKTPVGFWSTGPALDNCRTGVPDFSTISWAS
jgi:adenylosuccinate synthase